MFQKMIPRLTTRITFLIAIVLIGVFSIETVLTSSYLTEVLKDDTKSEIDLRLETLSKDIRNIFENANIVTTQMANNKEITTYLKEVKSRDDILVHPLLHDVIEILNDIKESSDTHFTAWISNEQANFYLDRGEISDASYVVKNRPWYKPAMDNNKVVYTSPYIELVTNKNVLSSILALREEGSVYGFVAIDISLESIPTIFESIKKRDGDHYYLINNEGQYIYHPQKNIESVFGLDDKTDPLYPYRDFILTSDGGTLKDIIFEGHDSLLKSYDIGVSGWRVVSIVEMDFIVKKIKQQIFWLILIFVITLLIAIIIIIVTVSKSIKPFRALTDYGREIAGGDLTINIPEVYTKRKDEMGELAKSFQVIVETFRKENDLLGASIIEKNKELEIQYRHIYDTERLASLGSLVAGIAHEINTPIGTCLSAATFLEVEKKNLHDKYNNNTLTKNEFNKFFVTLDEALEILTYSLRRAADLIINFKQVAVNQSSENKYLFNVKMYIDSVIVSLKHEYKRTQIMIENHCSEVIMLDSYPGAFGQVITNLIMNSIKHGFKSDQIGHIVIDAEESETHVKVIYRDDGKGMSKEVSDKMFDPFFTTNRSAGSSGLGMHIVFNIISQQLDGEISCETSLGEGVKFTLLIPKITEPKYSSES